MLILKQILNLDERIISNDLQSGYHVPFSFLTMIQIRQVTLALRMLMPTLAIKVHFMPFEMTPEGVSCSRVFDWFFCS